MQEDTFLRGNPAYVMKGIHLLRGNPKGIHQTGVKWPSTTTFRWYESRIKSLFYHSFKIIPSLKLSSIDDKFIFYSACLSANLGDKGLFNVVQVYKYSPSSRCIFSSCLLAVLAVFRGSKVSFKCTCKVLLVRFFSTSQFFPFEMSMTISDIKIRIDISHSLLMSWKV